MDFFEAQARAKKRTSRLVVLFGFAVFGIILATYLASAFILRESRDYLPRRGERPGYGVFSDPSRPLPSYWQPQLFVGVALATVAVVGLASLYKWNEFSTGGRAVAESVGGRPIDPRTTNLRERQFLNVVEEMAIASGVPVPAAYILDDEPALNAFAAGLTTNDAVVAVTRGTLDKLSRDELQGVVGHEFSHILNGDMRLNIRLTALVFGILVLGLAGRGILWSFRTVRLRGKNSGGVIIAIAVVGVALLIIGYVGYFFGRLIQAAVSRQREFLADASAVQFTRNPGGISGALKKIGGYALGSTLLSKKSGAIGHFLFAQGFRAGFTGFWSTHPPLAERIRAIDPSFDGKLFEPPEVVDVARQSFVAAGLTRATNKSVLERSGASPARGQHVLPSGPSPASGSSIVRDFEATAAVASIGTLTSEQLTNAQLLLEATPSRLRTAARTAREASVLIFGLLLDDDATIRAHQRSLVASRAGGDALGLLDEFDADLRGLRPEHKLPLLQLALPALRDVQPTALSPFLDTLDELVHADRQVTTFEFALQKLVAHTLALGHSPASAVVQYHSFNAVADEIAIVLSALARAAVSDPNFAGQAFAAGASQLKLIESRLSFADESASALAALDTALDKLARASGPIKQRTLAAAAHVVSADGRVLVTEFELLRAIAAALDCPMPPMATAA